MANHSVEDVDGVNPHPQDRFLDEDTCVSQLLSKDVSAELDLTH